MEPKGTEDQGAPAELGDGEAAVADTTPTGEEQASAQVIPLPGETGKEATERKEAEGEAEGEGGEGEEGAEGGEGEGAEGEDDERRPAAVTKKDWDAMQHRMAELHNFAVAANDYFANQAEREKLDQQRSAQETARRKVEELAKLPPDQQLSYKLREVEERAARAEREVASIREEKDRERRYVKSQQILRDTLDDIFEKKGWLGEWREEIEDAIPRVQGGSAEEIVRNAAMKIEQKVLKLKKQVNVGMVKPREELKGHRTMPATGGTAPPAAGRKPTTREDVLRILSNAVPPMDLLQQARRGGGRK